MQELLQQIDLRRLYIILGGILLLIMAAMFTYMVIPQFKGYRSAQSNHNGLAAVIEERDLETQLSTIEGEIASLQSQLLGDTANLPVKQMEAYIIGRLQKVSWSNNVVLVSVQPGVGQKVHKFQEILFKVELATNYFDFYNWLTSLKKELGFIVVKEFEIRSAVSSKDDSMLSMNLTIASYREDQ